LAIASYVRLATSIELQVGLVKERHLLRVHGDAYG
jgi:hypothetical protein